MEKKIKEYLTLLVRSTGDDTQDMLDERAKKGWKLICSYCGGQWLIMERDTTIEVCKCCGGTTK